MSPQSDSDRNIRNAQIITKRDLREIQEELVNERQVAGITYDSPDSSTSRFARNTRKRTLAEQIRARNIPQGKGNANAVNVTSDQNIGIEDIYDWNNGYQNLQNSRSRLNSGGVKKKLPSLAKSGGYGVEMSVVGFMYTIQFGLALLSAYFMFLIAIIKYFTDETPVGKVATAVIGFFTGLDTLVPNEAGLIFWVVVSAWVIVTFIGFLLWFTLVVDKNPFHSLGSTGITLFLLVLSFVPILNLFPWLVGWVFYVNTSSIYSLTIRKR